MKALLILLFASPSWAAAPKLDLLAAKPDPAAPAVVFTITVAKTGGDCEARLEFGDGKGRNLDFGMATTRTLRYVYRKGGSYTVSVKGTGNTPCGGAKEIAVSLKSAEPQKKAEKKKADKKSAPKKKVEPK